LKILIVSDYYPNLKHPQFCIFIQQQAQALISLGHQVEVIVPKSTYRLRERRNRILVAGIPVFFSEYFTLYKKIYCSIVLKRNIRVFKKQFDFSQYDIISIHMFDEFTLRIFLAIAKKYKKKVVIHYHGLSVLYDIKLPYHIQLLQNRGDRVLKKLIAKADAIVGVSNKVSNQVRANYNNSKVFTVYNGVNTDLFYSSKLREDNEYRIITVASLKKIKGNHYLIAAVKLLVDQYPDWNIKLIIIGHGPEKAALESLVASLQMENIVQFVGYIKYEEVAQIMKQCDVFAMPSYYEALGCVYLEAMACKLPVIGCKYQGIDEIIIDNENGLLVEPHNIMQLFEKLSYLIMYPDKAAELALHGYNTVRDRFTWRDSANSLVEVYTSLIDTK